jgi:hypothetical protein
MAKELIQGIIDWVRGDFKSHPVRCLAEIFAWALSIGCAVTMMLTVPTPPFLILYPLFITQCVIFGWSAWTRKSTGMLMNYMLLVVIDVVALTRLVIL